jgi:hypothetical protein
VARGDEQAPLVPDVSQLLKGSTTAGETPTPGDDLNEAIAVWTESLIPGLRSLDVVKNYFATEGEDAAITVSELASRAGVPAGTARRTLQRLVEMRVLVVVPGHGPVPDVYRLPSGSSRAHGSSPSGARGSSRRPTPPPTVQRRGRPRPDWTPSSDRATRQ